MILNGNSRSFVFIPNAGEIRESFGAELLKVGVTGQYILRPVLQQGGVDEAKR